mmetsp:Transcript_42195/g.101511  ORF Transcript_42195/g.101511 Transcript_42195/m.101511 type:complete len:200 (+) Transcript_42195:589-1188(+)
MRSDLTPEDPQPQFNQTLFDDLAMLSDDGITVTKEQLAEHQRDVIKASRMQNPDGSRIPVNTCGTQAAFTMLFGDDDDLDTARLDFVESFMKDNRIPDDYLTREERGVPNLLSMNDTGITSAVRAFFNTSIETALAMDLEEDDMLMTTMDPEGEEGTVPPSIAPDMEDDDPSGVGSIACGKLLAVTVIAGAVMASFFIS